MIRRLSEFFRGGYYEHRETWKPKHKCSIPSDGLFFTSHKGDIWRCKCGTRWECKGLGFFGHVKEWKEIIDEDKSEDEKEMPEPLWRLSLGDKDV